jgi:hypothetical protein
MSAPRGRPPVGPVIEVRLPADDLAVIDAIAERDGMTRAGVLRLAVFDAIEFHGWRHLPPRGMSVSRFQTNPPDKPLDPL